MIQRIRQCLASWDVHRSVPRCVLALLLGTLLWSEADPAFVRVLRAATPQDQQRLNAERAFAEGEQLRGQRTAESLGKAIKKYEEALLYWRAAGERTQEGSSLLGLGITYVLLGETQKALDCYAQALALFRAVGERRGEAVTLNNLGRLYEESGEKQQALDYYLQALPLRRAAGERDGEARTLYNIGNIYDYLGEKQQALDAYHQSLSLGRTLADHWVESHALTKLGDVFWSLGEPQQALDYYQQALPLLRTLGDRRDEAAILNNLGNAYGDLGVSQKKLEYLSQALTIYRAIKDRYGEAATLNNLGTVYGHLGESQTALSYYLQALPLRRAIGDRRGEAITLHNTALANAKLGETATAVEQLQQALQLIRAVGDRAWEARTLLGLARVESQRNNLSQARAQLAEALAIIESLRAKLATQELRASYLSSNRSYYELDIDLLMRLHGRHPTEGYAAAALQTSERARARSLLDLLTEARADIRQGVDPALLEHERRLQQQLDAKEQARMQLLSRKHTPEQAAAAEKELRLLTTEYQQLQAQIRTNSPRYAALTQPQPLSLPEIQQQVLDTDTLLLEYALGDERSYLWAVSPTSIHSFELPKRAEIEAAAQSFYKLLIAPDQPGRAATQSAGTRTTQTAAPSQSLAEAGVKLSQMLLAPVASQLGAKRLLIIADGALQYLPFAALPKPETGEQSQIRPVTAAPLVVNHEIISLPSASTLALLRRELAGRQPAPKTVALLADPVFGKDDSRVKPAVSRQRPAESKQPPTLSAPLLASDLERAVREVGVTAAGLRLPRLLGTRREAAAISAVAPERERKQALDFEASRATATSAELGQYRIIHFATHGLLNSTHPELSGIVLSLVDEQGQAQDGFLRLTEIYNLKLPAELVVLSACQTGLGKEIRGEGLVGLTRGFMYAGAARVVASLWKVDDKATAELMRRFYQGMLGPQRLRPAAALRAAQVALWQTKGWEDPYYWAAFVLQGEWK